MPRRPKSQKPRRRIRGTGSLSVHKKTGEITARVPAALSPTGKRLARQFRPGALAEAQAWLDAFVNPVPSEPVPAAQTLGEWSGTWWQTYVEPIAAPNTSRRYLYQLRQFGDLLDVSVSDLRASLIQGAVAKLAQRVTPAVVHSTVGVWRQCLEAAVDDGLIDRNPARRLNLPKMQRRPPPRYLTSDEAIRILDRARGHRYEAAFALLVGCGLRIGEVLGLEWRHVDLAGARAYIVRQWTGGQWRELPKAGPPRWIRLPPPVVRALIRHRNAQPPGCTLVLQSPKRRKRTGEIQPLSDDAIAAALRALAVELEIPTLTPHAGRRGIVTTLLDQGISPATAADVVGHSNTATTLRYAQATDTGAERSAGIIDAYLGETPEDAETAC